MYYAQRMAELGAYVERFPTVLFTVGSPAADGGGWADKFWVQGNLTRDRIVASRGAFSHLPSETPDPAFGLHVKYTDEYYAALASCFLRQPLEALGVGR